MATVKNNLRSFFLKGGTGTNRQLANQFNCSLSMVRKAVMELRDEGLPIERPVFAALFNQAVYRLSDAYFYRTNPTDYQDRRLGRPAHTQRLV